MANSVIIADSGPLIALSIIDKLELLQQLYEEVLLPPAVWNEVTVQGKGMPGADIVSKAKFLKVCIPEPMALKPLSIIVGAGEAEAIALAQTTSNCCVLLDDAQARRLAERLDICRIGTLGILRQAKKQGLISHIKPFILKLQSNGIYMQENLVNAILQDVGEV
jgi:predicted nucleic acid-binding protein